MPARLEGDIEMVGLPGFEPAHTHARQWYTVLSDCFVWLSSGRLSTLYHRVPLCWHNNGTNRRCLISGEACRSLYARRTDRAGRERLQSPRAVRRWPAQSPKPLPGHCRRPCSRQVGQFLIGSLTSRGEQRGFSRSPGIPVSVIETCRDVVFLL